MNETEPNGNLEAKVQLERELLKEQIAAAKEERRQRERPWWRNLTTLAALVSGVMVPFAVGAWSVVTGLWKAPLDDAELRARDEGFAARSALHELKEARLAEDVVRYEQRHLAMRILKELPEYRERVNRLANPIGDASFYALLASAQRNGWKPETDPALGKTTRDGWKKLLEEALLGARVQPPGLIPSPADRRDMLAQAIETRAAWGRELARAFPKESSLLLQDRIELPPCPELRAEHVNDLIDEFAQAIQRQQAPAERMFHEADRLAEWLSLRL